ncbi:HAUS augmin-like complex subunit 8 [Frankliniella fusca]|uniref:HAUS augmin-like complex subunit 8 n=1 Tax=Frankliniella fusca TaxID=407009 RepID=A0AAE1H6A2_9NEOP|nr:HAUS augmin-like complex subunit 8 [Frankliniella fusca]
MITLAAWSACWTTLAILAASADTALVGELARRALLGPEDDEDYRQLSPRLPGRAQGRRQELGPLLPHRFRRNTHTYAQALDNTFLHMPVAALEHLPDGESACDAMRNASVLRQVVPPQVEVMVEPPCPVRMRLLEDPQRVWPTRLMVAECACPATSCRPRTAYVCTQIISPVVVVMVDGDGHYHQHRVMLPSGCKCMTARATIVEYLDEDYK